MEIIRLEKLNYTKKEKGMCNTRPNLRRQTTYKSL